MDLLLTEDQLSIQASVADLCSQYPEDYWKECDRTLAYPEAFVDALAQAGWLSMLIPEEYGGGGGNVMDAAVVLETINKSGGSGVPAHAQMYTMGTILRHGSEEQKKRLLPRIATNEIRLQAFGVTEADAGSETTKIRTFARREGDEYVVNGSKMWTSRFQHSDYMLLLCRTSKFEDVEKKTDGLSILLVDIKEAGDAIKVRPIRTMTAHETNELVIENLRVPVENRIGEEGKGFRYILSGLNVERVLIASECLGDGYWFINKATQYANERVVFGRPIGANQGVAFPLARAYADLEAATLMRNKAAALYDAGGNPGFEANAAKLLASTATWAAANATMDTFGGYGLAVEFGIERKFREARLPMVAPINNNLILAYIGQHALGLPKSY
ncbi:MAG: acyl-CoA dehydrogenase [Aeromicrobium sp.]|jgi:acyl-CoA dehydrogenase|nr:acyl-CoA dehydrogenase [Aeromicrobium sp.]